MSADNGRCNGSLQCKARAGVRLIVVIHRTARRALALELLLEVLAHNIRFSITSCKQLDLSAIFVAIYLSKHIPISLARCRLCSS